MICPKCIVEMYIGEAIKPSWDANALYIIAPPYVNANTLEMIKCWKCPQCGHSDDGK